MDLLNKLRVSNINQLLVRFTDQPVPDCFSNGTNFESLANSSTERFQFAVLFTLSQADLSAIFHSFMEHVEYEGIIWVVYPKKSSGYGSDLHRDEGWKIVFNSGFRPVSQVSINEFWSAVRIRPGSLPDRNRQRPEIIVPEDFIQAMSTIEGLTELYYKQSYTHRKEYVNWISEAKKIETRNRRIVKAIEMLQNGNKRN